MGILDFHSVEYNRIVTTEYLLILYVVFYVISLVDATSKNDQTYISRLKKKVKTNLIFNTADLNS